MLGGSNFGSAKKNWTPFRDNLLRVLDRADNMNDSELKSKLQLVIDTEVDEHFNSKSEARRVVMMKKAH